MTSDKIFFVSATPDSEAEFLNLSLIRHASLKDGRLTILFDSQDVIVCEGALAASIAQRLCERGVNAAGMPVQNVASVQRQDKNSGSLLLLRPKGTKPS